MYPYWLETLATWLTRSEGRDGGEGACGEGISEQAHLDARADGCMADTSLLLVVAGTRRLPRPLRCALRSSGESLCCGG